MEVSNLNSFFNNQTSNDWKINQQVKGIKTLAKRTQFDIESIRSIKDKREQLNAAASEFESMFVEMMFKSMKKTLSNKSLLEGGYAEKIFDDMLLTERSRIIANNQSLGIAKMIYEQNSKYL